MYWSGTRLHSPWPSRQWTSILGIDTFLRQRYESLWVAEPGRLRPAASPQAVKLSGSIKKKRRTIELCYLPPFAARLSWSLFLRLRRSWLDACPPLLKLT